MEDILASIKRIIAEEGDAAPRERPAKPSRRPIAFGGADDEGAPEEEEGADRAEAPPQPIPAYDPSDEVLELTRTVDAPKRTALPDPSETPSPPPAKLVSEDAAVASRQALAALSAVVVKPDSASDNTLEGMVREMLRPVLKEWLDARLPDIVERLVAGEITRITGRGL